MTDKKPPQTYVSPKQQKRDKIVRLISEQEQRLYAICLIAEAEVVKGKPIPFNFLRLSKLIEDGIVKLKRKLARLK